MSTKRVEIVFDTKILGKANVEQLVGLAEKLQQTVNKIDTSKIGGAGSGSNAASKTIKDLADSIDQVAKKSTDAGRSFTGFASQVQSGVTSPIAAAEAATSRFLETMIAGPSILAGVALGIAAVAKESFDLVAAEGKAAEQLLNFSDRLGISANQSEKLQAASKIAGVNIGALESSAKLLAAALEDSGGAGAKTAAELTKLGVQTRTVSGGQREMGAVLLDTLAALAKIESTSERVRASQLTLGRGAASQLQPLIASYRDLLKVVEGVGVGVDENLTRRLAAADDKIGEAELAWEKLKKSFAGTILPAIEPFIEDLKALVQFANKIAVPDGPAGLQRRQFEPQDKFTIDTGIRVLTPQQALPQDFRAAFGNTEEGRRRRAQELTKKQAELEKQLSTGTFPEDDIRKDGDFAATFKRKSAELGKINSELAAQKFSKEAEKIRKEIQEFFIGSFEKSSAEFKDVLDQFLATDSRLAGTFIGQTGQKLVPGGSAGTGAVLDKTTSGLIKQIEKFFPEGKAIAGSDKAIEAVGRELSFAISKILGEKFEKRVKEEAAALEKSLEESTLSDSTKAAVKGLGLSGINQSDAASAVQALQNRAFLGSFSGLGRRLTKTARVTDLEGNADVQRRLDEIRAQAEISTIQRGSQFQQNVVSLSAGQGGEVAAILKAADIRVKAAEAQFAVEQKIAQLSGDNLKLEEAHFKLKAESDQASLDAATKLLELRQKEREAFKQGAERLFDAFKSNGTRGIGEFFKTQFLDNTLRTVTGNAAGLSFDFFKSNKLTLPGQGTAQNPNLLGKLLQGTPFGLDPLDSLKNVNLKQIDSTERLTATNERLIGAISGTPTSGSLDAVFRGTTAGGLSSIGGSLGVPSGVFQGAGSAGSSIFSLFGGNKSVQGAPPGADAAGAAELRRIVNATVPSPSTIGTKASTGPFVTAGGRSSVAGALFNSEASTQDRVVSGAASAAVAFGAFQGIKSGIKQGGARGTFTAISSGLGAAAAFDPEPISKAILSVAAVAAGIATSLFGDPKQKRQNFINSQIAANQYAEPVSSTREVDFFGRSVDFDSRGRARTNVYQTINIDNIDAQSLLDRSRDIADALRPAIANGHDIVRDMGASLNLT